MNMTNVIVMQGRLTKDVELRYTKSNKAVASFSLANEYRGKDASFYSCTAWGNTAEYMERYLNKGQMIVVTGHLQTREYDDKDGNHRKLVEIVADSVATCGRTAQTENEPVFTEIEDDGDELPF